MPDSIMTVTLGNVNCLFVGKNLPSVRRFGTVCIKVRLAASPKYFKLITKPFEK